MAGTLKTDIVAVAAAITTEEAAVQVTRPGYSVRANLDALLKNRDDVLRQAAELDEALPAGAAKDAMAVVIADLA